MIRDKELQMALTYFYMREEIRVREFSVDVLYSRWDENYWSVFTSFELNLN
tara:strand:+ start:762 stop:914 length:153 start_codon:yes stop_codon:yes gene_type:complete